MKVLHLENGRNLYGGGRQVLYLLEGLQAAGVENILVCPHAGPLVETAAAQVVTLAHSNELDPRFFFALRRLLADLRPDLVHVHSRRGADLWGGLAARSLGLPAVLSRRVDNRENFFGCRVKFPLYRRIVTISREIEKVLISQGVAAEKIVCVPSAVNPVPETSIWQEAKFRFEFGLDENDLVIGVVAQLIARKGHRLLIEAAAALIREGLRLKIIICGQGPLNDDLKRQVADAGLADQVIFAGFRTDLPEFLPHFDLLVHPARREGLGVAVLQAAAAGLPVVAFRAGGVPEIVIHDQTGLLVEPGDVEGLTRALRSLLAEDKLRRRMGENGRRRVTRDFSVAAMVAGNLQVYREILG